MLDEIRTNRDLLQDAYDQLPMGILVIDQRGSVVAANPHVETLLGYPPLELLGKPVERLVPQSVEQHHRALRLDYARHAHVRPMGTGRELAARHRDGRQIPVEIGLTPITRGHDQFVVCTLVEVSERRRLQSELQDVQRDVAVGNVIGGIAHDFNNILSGAVGYAELCKEQAGSDRDLQEYLDEILEIMRRGRQFVASILDVASNRTPKRYPVRWQTIIDDAIRLMRLTLPANVRIDMGPDDDVPEVHADPVELQRTFVNLFTNAVHASAKDGGVIEVHLDVAHVQSEDRVCDPRLPPGDYVRLRMIDEGIGMPAGVLERAFEPQFTTRTTEGGRGIGLFVSWRIIKALGGGIDIASQEGKGTRVDVYLPVAAPETRGARERSASHAAGSSAEERQSRACTGLRIC